MSSSDICFLPNMVMSKPPNQVLWRWLVTNRFKNIFNPAIHYLADTKKNIRGYVVSFAELCKGGRTDAGFFSQITLFHVLVNKHLPEFIVADAHIGKPSVSCEI